MRGTVERIEGNYAYVRIMREEMCGDCHACDMMGEKKKCEIKCFNNTNSLVGDVVEVDGSSNHFLKATGLMYGLPLICLLGGLGLGYLLPLGQLGSLREGVMIITGLGSMAGMFWWIKRRDAKKEYEVFLPTIIKVIND